MKINTLEWTQRLSESKSLGLSKKVSKSYSANGAEAIDEMSTIKTTHEVEKLFRIMVLEECKNLEITWKVHDSVISKDGKLHTSYSIKFETCAKSSGKKVIAYFEILDDFRDDDRISMFASVGSTDYMRLNAILLAEIGPEYVTNKHSLADGWNGCHNFADANGQYEFPLVLLKKIAKSTRKYFETFESEVNESSLGLAKRVADKSRETTDEDAIDNISCVSSPKEAAEYVSLAVRKHFGHEMQPGFLKFGRLIRGIRGSGYPNKVITVAGGMKYRDMQIAKWEVDPKLDLWQSNIDGTYNLIFKTYWMVSPPMGGDVLVCLVKGLPRAKFPMYNEEASDYCINKRRCENSKNVRGVYYNPDNYKTLPCELLDILAKDIIKTVEMYSKLAEEKGLKVMNRRNEVNESKTLGLGLSKRVADKEREKTADDVIAEMDVVYTPDEAGNFFYSKLKRHPDMQVFIERRLGPIVDVEINIKGKFHIDVIFRNWSDYPGVMTVHVAGPNQEKTMIVKRLMKIDLFKKSMFTGNGSYTERNPVFYNRYQEDTLRKDLISMIADTINSIVSKKLGLKESRSSLGLAKKTSKRFDNKEDRAVSNMSVLTDPSEVVAYVSKRVRDHFNENGGKPAGFQKFGRVAEAGEDPKCYPDMKTYNVLFEVSPSLFDRNLSEYRVYLKSYFKRSITSGGEEDKTLCCFVRGTEGFIGSYNKFVSEFVINKKKCDMTSYTIGEYYNPEDRHTLPCHLLDTLSEDIIKAIDKISEEISWNVGLSESSLGLAKKTRASFDFDSKGEAGKLALLSSEEEIADRLIEKFKEYYGSNDVEARLESDPSDKRAITYKFISHSLLRRAVANTIEVSITSFKSYYSQKENRLQMFVAVGSGATRERANAILLKLIGEEYVMNKNSLVTSSTASHIFGNPNGYEMIVGIVDKFAKGISEYFKEQDEKYCQKVDESSLGLAKKTSQKFDKSDGRAIDSITLVSTPEEAVEVFTRSVSDKVRYEVSELRHLLMPDVSSHDEAIANATKQDNHWSKITIFSTSEFNLYFYFDRKLNHPGSTVALGVFVNWPSKSRSILANEVNKMLFDKYGDCLFDLNYTKNNKLPLFCNPEDPLHLKTSMIEDIALKISEFFEQEPLVETNLGLAKKMSRDSVTSDSRAIGSITTIDDCQEALEYIKDRVEAEAPGYFVTLRPFSSAPSGEGKKIIVFRASKYGPMEIMCNHVTLSSTSNSAIKRAHPETIGKTVMCVWTSNILTSKKIGEDDPLYRNVLNPNDVVSNMLFNPDDYSSIPTVILDYLAKSVIYTIKVRERKITESSHYLGLAKKTREQHDQEDAIGSLNKIEDIHEAAEFIKDICKKRGVDLEEEWMYNIDKDAPDGKKYTCRLTNAITLDSSNKVNLSERYKFFRPNDYGDKPEHAKVVFMYSNTRKLSNNYSFARRLASERPDLVYQTETKNVLDLTCPPNFWNPEDSESYSIEVLKIAASFLCGKK